MKTYSIIYAFLALVVIGCSTSNDTDTINEFTQFYKADYTLLMHGDDLFSSQLVSINDDGVTIDPSHDGLAISPMPVLALQQGTIYVYYKELDVCGGEVTIHDFSDGSSETVAVFPEFSACELEVTGVELQDSMLYVSYVKKENAKTDKYYVRVIDIGSSEPVIITDVELVMKPLQMVYLNNRLFVLMIDLEITNENSLAVVDGSNNTLINEIGLGYNAKQIFKNANQELIISYEELHTILNSTTFGMEYVRYESGNEPKFHDSRFNFMNGGTLYYKLPTDDPVHATIPAIYNFDNNLAVLYYYENFLTEAQLDIEFKIGETTLVSYDESNGILIIGYMKKDKANEGGLLRIEIDPDPKVIDNTDLAGVPYLIYYP